MQGLSLSSAVPFCARHFFSVALGQHKRSCLTVIHFSLHSFTLFCLLSVLARHHRAKQDSAVFFFFPARPVASRPRKRHELFIREHHWEEHPRIPVNVFRFSTQSDLPSSLYPFLRALRRMKIRISWLLARWASEKKRNRRKPAMRFLRRSRIMRFAAA